MLGGAVPAVLHAIPASHPCAAVEAALGVKGIPYERVDHLPLLGRLPMRVRFGPATVPALELPGGKRVTGSGAIMRALDERVPTPPLLPPAGDERRPAVERAATWGEEVLQPLARRLIWAALRRAPGAMLAYASDAPTRLPPALARLAAPLVARAEQAVHHAHDPDVLADLLHLDGHLRRVEGWTEDGTVGGAAPNAADLQIGASLRLLLTIEDLAGVLDGRPAAALARRWFPDFPGRVPAGALPADWLPGA
jgi:glutathione S-transferase